VLATVLASAGHLPTTVFRPPVDKLGHLLAYGVLSFLGVSFFGPARRWRVIAVLLVPAPADARLQRAFPTPTFALSDLPLNVVGIVALGVAARRRPARAGTP